MTMIQRRRFLFLWLCYLFLLSVDAKDDAVDLTTFFDATHTPSDDYMSHENKEVRRKFQRRLQRDKQEAMARRFLASQASRSSVSSTEDQTATQAEAIQVAEEITNDNPRKHTRRTRGGRRRVTESADETERQNILNSPLQQLENRRDATGRGADGSC